MERSETHTNTHTQYSPIRKYSNIPKNTCQIKVKFAISSKNKYKTPNADTHKAIKFIIIVYCLRAKWNLCFLKTAKNFYSKRKLFKCRRGCHWFLRPIYVWLRIKFCYLVHVVLYLYTSIGFIYTGVQLPHLTIWYLFGVLAYWDAVDGIGTYFFFVIVVLLMFVFIYILHLILKSNNVLVLCTCTLRYVYF